jgi:hypothetical protein
VIDSRETNHAAIEIAARAFGEGGAGEIGAREADGGERGQRELGESDVVEADDREIVGHAQAFHVGGAQNADGGHVVGADDGGGARGELAATARSRRRRP